MTDAAGFAVRARVDARAIELDVAAAPGRTLGVVGPNGSGKSTLIQLLSGRLRPDEGTVTLGGRVVAGPGRWVPPWGRRVALLAQRPLLFPHLDIAANVAFGPRSRGVPAATARARAAAELDAVGCAELGRRRPHELSGGQAQRVALARALAIDPEVVLLDEPLSSLDVTAAASVRALLAERLRRRTVVLVTHDALDLWSLADDLAVLDRGRCVELGGVDAVLSRPPTAFVADLGGLNRLVGTAEAPDQARVGALLVAGVPDAVAPAKPGGAVLALFEPAAVALFADAGLGSPRNRWPATVTGLEPRGGIVRVRLDLDGAASVAADLTPRSVAGLGVRVGARFTAVVKAAQVRITPTTPRQ